jgi:hypothetical protein
VGDGKGRYGTVMDVKGRMLQMIQAFPQKSNPKHKQKKFRRQQILSVIVVILQQIVLSA